MKSVTSETACSTASRGWNNVVHGISISFLIFDSFFQFIKWFDLHHVIIRGNTILTDRVICVEVNRFACSGIDDGFNAAFDMIFDIVSSSVESYQISINDVHKDCNKNCFNCLHFYFIWIFRFNCFLQFEDLPAFFIRNGHARINEEEAVEIFSSMLAWDHFLLWNNR